MTGREVKELRILSAGAAQGLIEVDSHRSFWRLLALRFAQRSVRSAQSARNFSRASNATH